VQLNAFADFTLKDCFKIFDRYDRGFVDISDVLSALQRLGVYKSHGDVALLVRRLSQGLSTLSMDQFDALVLSRDPKVQFNVRRRIWSGKPLKADTMETLKRLLNVVVSNEVYIVHNKDILRSN